MPRDNTMTVSIPREMLREVDEVRKREHRTRSELVREALRAYMRASALPIYAPTKRELAAIRKGREEISRGEYYTLAELRASLDSHHLKTRSKEPRTRTTPRKRTALARA